MMRVMMLLSEDFACLPVNGCPCLEALLSVNRGSSEVFLREHHPLEIGKALEDVAEHQLMLIDHGKVGWLRELQVFALCMYLLDRNFEFLEFARDVICDATFLNGVAQRFSLA